MLLDVVNVVYAAYLFRCFECKLDSESLGIMAIFNVKMLAISKFAFTSFLSCKKSFQNCILATAYLNCRRKRRRNSQRQSNTRHSWISEDQCKTLRGFDRELQWLFGCIPARFQSNRNSCPLHQPPFAMLLPDWDAVRILDKHSRRSLNLQITVCWSSSSAPHFSFPDARANWHATPGRCVSRTLLTVIS